MKGTPDAVAFANQVKARSVQTWNPVSYSKDDVLKDAAFGQRIMALGFQDILNQDANANRYAQYLVRLAKTDPSFLDVLARTEAGLAVQDNLWPDCLPVLDVIPEPEPEVKPALIKAHEQMGVQRHLKVVK